MLKKSTLLSVSIFFLLFIGLSDYGYGCHKGTDGPHGKFNDCGEPPGGGGDEVLYDVIIYGDVSGDSHDPWQGNFTGGAKSIGLQINMVHTPDPDVGAFHDLSFFTLPDGPFGTNGELCFPGGANPYEPFPIFQVIVKQGRHGSAEGKFWFMGKTFDMVVPVESVLYRLDFFGVIEGPWPPPSDAGATLMKMTYWELSVANGDEFIRNISCIGETEDGDPDFEVGILVTRTK